MLLLLPIPGLIRCVLYDHQMLSRAIRVPVNQLEWSSADFFFSPSQHLIMTLSSPAFMATTLKLNASTSTLPYIPKNYKIHTPFRSSSMITLGLDDSYSFGLTKSVAPNL